MSGSVQVNWAGEPLERQAVGFTLLPAALGRFEIEATAPATALRSYVPA
jgi:hypothetical protein